MDNDQREQQKIHIEMYRRSLDTCRVHNPTDQDYIIQWDRAATNQKWLVPNKNKDVGKGKGNADVPRFVADRYVRKMGINIINVRSKEDWDKKKTKYREEERSKYEESFAIRTDNVEIWQELLPELFLGVVSRYGGEDIPEPEAEMPEHRSGNITADVMANMNLSDKMIVEENKQELVNAISQ